MVVGGGDMSGHVRAYMSMDPREHAEDNDFVLRMRKGVLARKL